MSNSDYYSSDDEDPIKKENELLKVKIKKQKLILRRKIENARKKAYLTENPECVEKAEKDIKNILEKHHLTEEMIKDDED